MGLLEGIKVLGINDLSEKEIAYLLRVLTKPELDSAIVMPEFLQIMENLGLYDDDQGMDGQREMDDGDESSPDAAAIKAAMDEMDGQQVEEKPKKKKKNQALDLSKLDQKSVKIMVMLMVELLQTDRTTQEFFEEVVFEQNVKTKTK